MLYFISAYIASDDIRISAGARASMPKITHTATRIIESHLVLRVSVFV